MLGSLILAETIFKKPVSMHTLLLHVIDDRLTPHSPLQPIIMLLRVFRIMITCCGGYPPQWQRLPLERPGENA